MKVVVSLLALHSVFGSYMNLMLYINAQVKLIQYNFGFPNSFISHMVSELSKSLEF